MRFIGDVHRKVQAYMDLSNAEQQPAPVADEGDAAVVVAVEEEAEAPADEEKPTEEDVPLPAAPTAKPPATEEP